MMLLWSVVSQGTSQSAAQYEQAVKSSDTPALTKSTHELLGNTNETPLARKIVKKSTQESLKVVMIDKQILSLFFLLVLGFF